ncbi:MAG: hypothetical protein AB9903_12505 [Vulcanimicrobiota bacterium]
MANQGQRRPKSTLTKTLNTKVEEGVCRQALRYAEKRKTHISVIVEEALREYLRKRAPYLSDIHS